MDPLIFSLKEVVRFGIVLMRIGGIMAFAPLFNSPSIPTQCKVIIVLVSTMALVPSVPLALIPDDFGLATILLCAVSQVLFGMVLGLVASFIFAGLQFAGQIVSFQLGFALVNLIDPMSDVEMPVFSFLLDYLGLIFLLLLGGHHWFFLAVSDSFNYLPITGITLKGPIVHEIIRLSSQILVSGVQIAGPIIAVTVIADVVLGIIGRAAPQINILIVGMPVKTLVGFMCLSFSFYFLPHLLGKLFMQLYQDLFALMRGMA
jgi:flagellar biosynthetic protein FliR